MFKSMFKRKAQPKSVSYIYGSDSFMALMIRHEIKAHLQSAESKPPRRIKKRDGDYLSQQARGLFAYKPGQIFLNPTDHQLDKIFDGELWGYNHVTIH